MTSAMSKVTDTLINAARRASEGQWDATVRHDLFDRHKAVADTLIGDDPARHAAVLDSLRQRLDRFEKLCFGLSMVHELTPRLLDAISGTGEMLTAPLLVGGNRGPRPFVAARGCDRADRDDGSVRRRGAADGRHARQDARAARADAGGGRDPGGHRLHRRHGRRRPDDARTRRVRLLGVDCRRGARCRRSLDLDGRGRRHDRQSRGGPGGAHAGRDLLQRGVGAGVLRRKGPALQDDPSGVPPAHPGAHPQQLQPGSSGNARQRGGQPVGERREGGDVDPEGRAHRDQRHGHAGHPRYCGQGVRRRGRASRPTC